MTRFLIVLAMTCAMLHSGFPASADQQRAQVESLKGSFEDLASILNVHFLGATVTLPQKPEAVYARLDFYRNGERLLSTMASGLGGYNGELNRFNVAVSIVDTDFLKLGDAPEGHHRFVVKIEECDGLKSISRWNEDVPKSTFDPSRSRSFGIMSNNKTPEELPNLMPLPRQELPIMYLIVSRSGTTTVKGTVPEILEANPDADIMVVVLMFEPASIAGP